MVDRVEHCVLESELILYPKKTKAKVKLTTTAISIYNESSIDVINLNDITGCHIVKGNSTTLAKWHFCVFFYPLKKKMFKGQVRHKLSRSFGVESESSEEENLNLAQKWKNAIKHFLAGIHFENVDQLEELPVRNLVVYVNPFSGQGKALNMYQNHVIPMFSEAEVKHTMIMTKYAGNAKDMVKNLDLNEFDGIVIVSGDGLVHEVINGLMEREDWRVAIKMPLGVVPGGSGNALAASIIYSSTGCHPPPSHHISSLLEICRGRVKDIDLMAVQTCESPNKNVATTRFSVLGFVLGLISDIDIESEKLRFLGGTLRNNIYAAMRVATKRSYDVSISFRPTSEQEKVELVCDGAGRNAPSTAAVSITDDLPSSWVTMDCQSVQVTGILLSHIGDEFVMHPLSKLDDGVINLTLIDGSITRSKLMNLWGKLEKGLGLVSEDSCVEVISCSAFRVVPQSSYSKIMTLDGERISYGPVHCQIHKSLARVFRT